MTINSRIKNDQYAAISNSPLVYPDIQISKKPLGWALTYNGVSTLWRGRVLSWIAVRPFLCID